MSRTRIQRHYASNFVNIVLAVVSIIQGLAFNDLANLFPQIYSAGFFTGDYRVIAHFVLCFVLLLRVFQTYVAAALDYDEWEINFADIFIIFIVGLLEYFVFYSLKQNPFDVVEFHKRLSILSVLGFLGYTRAYLKIRGAASSHAGVRSQYYRLEARLQLANLLGIVTVLAVSVFVCTAPPQTDARYTALGLTSAAALLLNIYYSLRCTFLRPVTDMLQPAGATPAAAPAAAQEERLNVDLREARKEDVDALLGLLMGNFAYVYTTLFDASPRLTRRILRSILLVNRGRHPLGFRSFRVAVSEQDEEVVGLVLYTRARRGVDRGRVAGMLGSALVVMRRLGLVGLLRTLKNSKPVRASTEPIVLPGELHVTYLAVDKSCRRRGVGARLINASVVEAARLGLGLVALEVREDSEARAFFARMGFTEESIIKNEYDTLWSKGGRVRMTRAVPQPDGT
ncbi:MAG TPA: N-acetyltransferase [Pyrinomonadaceae bacterium]|nr:N-acetyltransferase [Pyrinomonadaceae bacterium]